MSTRSDGTDTLHGALVGMEVATFTRGKLIDVWCVVHVDENRIVLEDGSEWRMRGGIRWGSSRSFHTASVMTARLVVDHVAFDAETKRRKARG